MEDGTKLCVDEFDCLPGQDLKWSYFHGVSQQPLNGLPIGHVLETASREKPDHVVFHLPEFNQSLTYSQLLRKANHLARGFLALGMSKGDVVFCYRLCDEHFYIVFMACALIGLAFINPYIFTPKDVYLKRLLIKSRPALLIADTTTDSFVGEFLEQLVANDLASSMDNFQRPNTLKAVVTVNSTEFEGIPTISGVIKKGESVADNMLTSAKKKVSADDCVYIFATSGSSGDAKLVRASHYNLVNYSIFCVGRRAQGKREVMGYLSPLRDDVMAPFGAIEMICQWRVGSVGVVLPQSVDFSDQCTVPLLQAIQKHRITRPGAYPFQILNMINSPEFSNYDTSSLTGVTLVAQAISPETRAKLLGLFPYTVVAYGQSENISIACTHPGIKYKDTSVVGYPLAHHEVKVVGQSGEVLPVEEVGEIWVRGPCVFLGYLHDDEKTREVLDANGWVHSGDVGKMNSDSYITLVGRKADCIRYKCHGDVVYPGHIEKTVSGYDKVKEAVIVGVQEGDEDGDSICLCVIPKPDVSLTKENLENFCRDKLITRDLPNYFFIMESFPVTGARQKVSRAKLKEFVKDSLVNSSQDI